MKMAFQKLLSVNLGLDDEDKYTANPVSSWFKKNVTEVNNACHTYTVLAERSDLSLFPLMDLV